MENKAVALGSKSVARLKNSGISLASQFRGAWFESAEGKALIRLWPYVLGSVLSWHVNCFTVSAVQELQSKFQLSWFMQPQKLSAYWSIAGPEKKLTAGATNLRYLFFTDGAVEERGQQGNSWCASSGSGESIQFGIWRPRAPNVCQCMDAFLESAR